MMGAPSDESRKLRDQVSDGPEMAAGVQSALESFSGRAYRVSNDRGGSGRPPLGGPRGR